MNFLFRNKEIFYRNKTYLLFNSRSFVSLSHQTPLTLSEFNSLEDSSLSDAVKNLHLRQVDSLQFCRFFWLSQYLSTLNFGSQIFLVILESFLDEEELKYSLYSGVLLSKSLSTNEISVVIRQSLGGCSVERTFFLNATNFVFIKKI
jgi:hypothetical protein